MGIILHILWVVLVVSAIIAVVWLFDRIFGERAGYRWRKILWLILAICLIFPVPVNLSTFGNLFHGLEVSVDIPEQISVAPVENHSLVNENVDQLSEVESADAGQNAEFVPINVSQAASTKQISTEKVIAGLWIIGSLVMLGLRIGQYYHMKKRYLADSFVCEKAVVIEKEQCLYKELGIKREIPIRIMKQKESSHNSPMLLGYVNPMLLLPDVSYAENELDAILRHELLHYQSKDLWYKLLFVIVCDIYWFDPILRLMKNMAFRDVECVCDEKATRNMDLDAKRDYSNTILKTMASVKRNDYAFSTQFFGTKKNARERFDNIFSKHNRKAGITMLCLFLLMLVTGTACVSVTSSEKESETKVAGEKEAEALNKISDSAEVTTQQEEMPEEARKITIASSILPEDSDSLLDELRKQYPDYEITVTDFTWDYRMALFENSEQFPTVFQVYDSNALALAEAGRVADITDILEERGWLNQMENAFKAQVSDQNGRVYGIPRPSYAFGLMVNVEMFQKAGLVDEAGVPILPATWEELAEEAVKIKNATGEAGFCLIADDILGSVQFFNLAWSFGATDLMIQEADGSYKANLDSDGAIAAMEFVKDLRWKYDVLTENPTLENYNTGYEHLANGTAAMYIGANDAVFMPAIYGMEENGIALGAMPAGPGGEQYSYYGTNVFVFPKDASPEEINVTLSLLEMLGLGPVPNDAAKSRIYYKIQNVASQGGPLIPEIHVWNNEELLAYEQGVIDEMGDTNQELYQSFFEKVYTPGNLKGATFIANSDVCIALSSVLHEVVTNPDADVEQLMKKANDSWQKSIDVYSETY